MGDHSPLYFTARLGGLFPANVAAEEAMKEIAGTVRATLTGGKANQRRRSLYWVLVGIVAPILNDMHNMTLTDDDLHDIMRDKLGMFDEETLPSGEVYRKRWSTSNRAMNEADRAAYLNKCIEVWSKWTGIEPHLLAEEGRRAA